MTDEDVVSRVAKLLGVRYIQLRRDKRNPNWKDYFSVMQRGLPAVNLMQRLRPLMGIRRTAQIDAAIATYSKKRYRFESKLSLSDAREIRAEFAAEGGHRGLTAAMARKYGVSHPTMRGIRDGKYYPE